MNMLRKIIRYISAATLIIITFTASELIYIYKNKPSYFNVAPAILINYYIKKGNLTGALSSLSIIANLNLKEAHTSNPLINPEIKISNSNLESIGQETQNKIFDLLHTSTSYNYYYTNPQRVSNIYYHIGLILYEDKYYEYSANFFQNAVYLNPGLSFLHVELANLYFSKSEMKKGLDILDKCSNNASAGKHCRDYINLVTDEQHFDKVGEFAELIDKFQKKDRFQSL